MGGLVDKNSEIDWLDAAVTWIVGLLSFVLAGSAIKIYYSMERKRRDILILAARFGVLALFVVPLAIIIPTKY